MDISKIPNSVWLNIVRGQSGFEPDFLAAKILLSRLQLNVRQNPDTASRCAEELKDLFIRVAAHPKAQVDMQKIIQSIGSSL